MDITQGREILTAQEEPSLLLGGISKAETAPKAVVLFKEEPPAANLNELQDIYSGSSYLTSVFVAPSTSRAFNPKQRNISFNLSDTAYIQKEDTSQRNMLIPASGLGISDIYGSKAENINKTRIDIGLERYR